MSGTPAGACSIADRLVVRPAGQDVAPYYSLAHYPDAVCNDHRPAVYYFRPATPGSAHATRWLIYLEGGGMCDTNASNGVGRMSCRDRYEHDFGLLTATGWTARLEGLLSADPAVSPDFADANVVDVHYCSSDYWSGGRTHTAPFHKSNAANGWDFQGRAIAMATLMDLDRRHAVTGFRSADQVLFAGSSAGGEGIGVTLNDLLPLLPPSARKQGVLDDGGFSLEIDGFDPSDPPGYMSNVVNSDALIGTGIPFWNGHGDTPCWKAAQNKGIPAQIACYATGALFTQGGYAIGAFVAEAEEDSAQLGIDGWTANATGSGEYLKDFADAMRAELDQLPNRDGVFAPGIHPLHTMYACNDTMTTAYGFPNGVTETPADALHDWIDGTTAHYVAHPAPLR